MCVCGSLTVLPVFPAACSPQLDTLKRAVMDVAGTIIGLVLCTLAGVSGAFAAVAGKVAGLKDIELTTQVVSYLLLIAVSGCGAH